MVIVESFDVCNFSEEARLAQRGSPTAVDALIVQAEACEAPATTSDSVRADIAIPELGASGHPSSLAPVPVVRFEETLGLQVQSLREELIVAHSLEVSALRSEIAWLRASPQRPDDQSLLPGEMSVGVANNLEVTFPAISASKISQEHRVDTTAFKLPRPPPSAPALLSTVASSASRVSASLGCDSRASDDSMYSLAFVDDEEYVPPVSSASRKSLRFSNHPTALETPPSSKLLAGSTEVLSILRQSQKSGNKESCFVRDSTQQDTEVHPVWIDMRQKSMLSQSSKGSRLFCEGVNEDEDEDEYDEDEDDSLFFDIFKALRLKPNSPARVRWDFCGFALIGYDALVVPIQVFFDLEEPPLMVAMTWIARLFWTLDIILSFFTGYLSPAGKVVMDPFHIAKHYMRTWLLFDITVVIFDWVQLAEQESEASSTGSGIAKSARTLRVLRFFRLLRLMRLANKAADVAGSLTHRFRSEVTLIYFGILRIVIIILVIAHIIACAWYGVGTKVTGYGSTWVMEHNIMEQPLSHRYATSFHWSLMQFTGLGNEFAPTNYFERTYQTIVTIFAWVVSACMVSIITTRFTRLQLIQVQDSKRMHILTQYLMDSGISRQLTNRVMRNARHAIVEQKKNMPEKNVEMLALISQPLRVELHYEVNGPILEQHPFFSGYNEENAGGMRHVCHGATKRLLVMKGDVLLSDGQVPDDEVAMLWVLSGSLLYLQDSSRPHKFDKGEWANEPVLWAVWVHRGLLRASSESSLLCLVASRFQKIARKFKTAAFYPSRYAEEYVTRLNTSGPETYYEVDSVEIAHHVFPSKHRDDSSRNSGHRGSSTRKSVPNIFVTAITTFAHKNSAHSGGSFLRPGSGRAHHSQTSAVSRGTNRSRQSADSPTSAPTTPKSSNTEFQPVFGT